MAQPKFVQLSDSQVMIKMYDRRFLLEEGDRGVYSAGKCVRLYQFHADGSKHFMISVGWTRPDCQPKFDGDLIKGITNWDEIKKQSVDYIDKLLN